MDIKEELDQNQSVLLIMPGLEYNHVVLDTIKKLSEKSVCYVTLNKTFDSLKELSKKNNIDLKDIVFVDAISKTIKETPDQADGSYFVSSPGALTELSIAVNKLLAHGFEYLIFDSITNIAIYQKQAPVAKFISILVNKIKAANTKTVFYAVHLKEHSELIQECSMFFDKVIDLEK